MEENGGNVAVEAKKEEGSSSYRYWVRDLKEGDAAPLPVPKKISPNDAPANPPPLGSVWNGAGTWEEKSLNSWASSKIKEVLVSLGALEFSAGKAEIEEVTRCSGDAFLVTVRNKKRVGYTYELSLKIKGEWTIKDERKTVKGDIEIPEFSFGELDDLQLEVSLRNGKDLSQQDEAQITRDLKLFLQPLREKLLQFEQELKDR